MLKAVSRVLWLIFALLLNVLLEQLLSPVAHFYVFAVLM